MTNLFVLVDSRHKPQKIDIEFIQWLEKMECRLALYLLKWTNLAPNAGLRNVEEYKKHLLEMWEELPPVFLTSSEDRRGREELLDYIDSINKSIKSDD